MSRDKKETYRSPEVEVLDIRQEGVICSSGVYMGVDDSFWNNNAEQVL